MDTIINGRYGGYGAEITAYNGELSYNLGCVIDTALGEGDLKLKIIAGGRYFNRHYTRCKTHQLSQRIIHAKDSDSQDRLFYAIYHKLLECCQKDGDIFGITCVPPKPNDPRHRFYGIIKRLCEDQSYVDLANNFRCGADFPSQKGLSGQERAANVKDKFIFNQELPSKKIILIDDVITTGSTALECAKVLYRQGAAEVTLLVLGINQFENQGRNTRYVDLTCDLCREPMTMRFKNRENTAFFGCSSYGRSNCKNSYPFQKGFCLNNENNRILPKES